MPVRQDNILTLLASAKAYRAQVTSMEEKLRKDAEAIQKGILTISTAEYNHDLWVKCHYELLDLERLHSVVIQLCDGYYTEAIVRRNEKHKERQRQKRRQEGIEIKKIAVRETDKFLLAPVRSPMDMDAELLGKPGGVDEAEVERLRKAITGE